MPRSLPPYPPKESSNMRTENTLWAALQTVVKKPALKLDDSLGAWGKPRGNVGKMKRNGGGPFLEMYIKTPKVGTLTIFVKIIKSE